MQFKSVVAALPLVAFAAADVNQFVSDVGAYYSSLASDSSFLNVVQGLATVNPSILQSVQALATPNTDINALATPPAFISALPSPYNSVFMSVYSHELAIASSDGVLKDGKVVTGVGAQLSSIAATATGGSAGSAISSAASVATASGSQATQAASVSTGGAASPTGMIVMGGVAGAIGVVAALL